MKIRNGFVSNSSSSSYVILVPKNFDIEDYMEDNPENVIRASLEADINLEEAKQLSMNTFNRVSKKGGYLSEYDEAFWILPGILKDFIISEIETGPETGRISFVKEESIEKKAKIYVHDPDKKKKRKEKRERLRKKYVEHDPYQEETWEDENEKLKLKKFKDI